MLPPIVHSQAHPGFTKLASGNRVMAGGVLHGCEKDTANKMYINSIQCLWYLILAEMKKQRNGKIT